MDYYIEVVKPNNDFYVKQCLEIASKYHVDKGGKLGYYNAVKKDCEFIICAISDEKVLGYLGVHKNRYGEMVVVQTAVDKDFQGKGIATSLMRFLKHHSLGTSKIISFVDKDNLPAIKLHLGMGFNHSEESYDMYFEINTSKIVGNEILQETVEERENF